MSFDPGAQLDPGQISDRRGMGGRTGLAVGGGGLGLVLLLAYTLLGGNPNDLGPLLDPGAVTGPESSALATECKTGEDANQRDDCRILGYVNSIQAYWTASSPPRTSATCRSRPCCSRAPRRAPAGRRARPPARSTARATSSSTSTSGSSTTCAPSSAPRAARSPRATSSRTSTATTSRTSSGSSGASRRRARAPQGGSVRTELQADCLAGVWANHAEAGILAPLTAAQIADGLDAAAAVGDDRIQEAVSGQVNPEGWTHGIVGAAPALVHAPATRAGPPATATRSAARSEAPAPG